MATPVTRRVILFAAAALIGTLGGAVPEFLRRARATPGGYWVAGGAEPTPSPAPLLEKTAEAQPGFNLAALDPAKLVNVETKAWYSWALLDRSNGTIIGSANMHEPNRACSMIKAWIAADYLGQVKSPSQARQDDIETMIRDSDSLVADEIMDELGRLKSFTRMKNLCQTADFTPTNSWSMLTISAHDTCRLADTVAAAKVANPQWTQWLLGLMRTVREGAWGIRYAFATEDQSEIAIKNGWDDTEETDQYFANCLAVHEKWAMAVLTRYPTTLSSWEKLGGDIGETVARQLLQRDELRPLFG